MSRLFPAVLALAATGCAATLTTPDQLLPLYPTKRVQSNLFTDREVRYDYYTASAQLYLVRLARLPGATMEAQDTSLAVPFTETTARRSTILVQPLADYARRLIAASPRHLVATELQYLSGFAVTVTPLRRPICRVDVSHHTITMSLGYVLGVWRNAVAVQDASSSAIGKMLAELGTRPRVRVLGLDQLELHDAYIALVPREEIFIGGILFSELHELGHALLISSHQTEYYDPMATEQFCDDFAHEHLALTGLFGSTWSGWPENGAIIEFDEFKRAK